MWTSQCSFRLLGQGQIVRSMRGLDRLPLLTFGERFPAILADRLQHQEADLLPLLRCLLQQVLVNQ